MRCVPVSLIAGRGTPGPVSFVGREATVKVCGVAVCDAAGVELRRLARRSIGR